MDPRRDDRVRSFVERIKQEYRIEKIIFFGSRVRGENLEDSDYDIIVVSKDFQGVFFTDRISELSRYWSHDIPLEVLCYTPEEFREKSKQISIVREAVRDGLTIPL